MYVLYDDSSDNMTGEYISAKSQWRNWGDTLGAIAPPSRESRPFQKEYKKEIFHLILPHFNF